MSTRHASFFALVLLLYVTIGGNAAAQPTWEYLGGPLNDSGYVATIIRIFPDPWGHIHVVDENRTVARYRKASREWSIARPEGGASIDILSMAAHPGGLLFAAANAAGLWVSRDSGLTYAPLATAPNDLGACTAVDVLPDNSILVGGDRAVFRSYDAGQVWTRLNLADWLEVRFIVHRAVDRAMAIATSRGLLVSYDNGRWWQSVTVGLQQTALSFLVATPERSMYAVQMSGSIPKLHWTPSGTSWDQRASYAYVARIKTMVAIHDSILFIGRTGGLDMSTNTGHTWVDMLGAFLERDVHALAVAPDHVLYVGASPRIPAQFDSDRNGGLFSSSTPISSASPDAPELVAPIDDTRDTASVMPFRWKPAGGADTYTLQIARTARFDTLVHVVTGIPDTYFAPPTLPRGVRLFWRVRSDNDVGHSAWSAPRFFYYGAPAPVLVAPQPGQVFTSASNSLLWNLGESRPPYRVQCAADSQFSSLVYDSAGIMEPGVEVAFTSRVGMLYIRVASMVGEETGAWSPTVSFRVAAAGPFPWLSMGGPQDDASRAVTITALCVDHTGALHAGTEGEGIFRSSDRGRTWARTMAPPGGIGRVTSILDLRTSALRYRKALIHAIVPDHGLYSSSDSGVTWLRNASLMADDSVRTLIAVMRSRLLLGTTRGVRCSPDEGLTWQRCGTDLEGRSVLCLAVHEYTSRIYCGTDSGVFVSTNWGDSWSLFSDGLPRQPIGTILVNPAHTVYCTILGTSHLYRSRKESAWERVIPDEWTAELALLGNDAQGAGYVTSPGFGIKRSWDEGATWDDALNAAQYPGIVCMYSDDTACVYLGTRGHGVLVSHGPPGRALLNAPRLLDPEDGMKTLSNPPTVKWLQYGANTFQVQVSSSPQFDSALAADVMQKWYTNPHSQACGETITGLEYGKRYWWRVRGGNKYGSSPWSAARSFTLRPTPVPNRSGPNLLRPIADAQVAYNGMYFVWQKSDSGCNSTYAYISMDSTFLRVIKVAWVNFPTDSVYIGGLQTNARYYWRAQYHYELGNSLWSRTESFVTGTVTGEDPVVQVSSAPQPAILPNVPHPIHTTTQIPYHLSRAGAVTLTIHDALGRLVATLVDGVREAGTHQARFDAQGLPAGVYTARLETPSGSAQRVMLLVR